MRNDQLSMEALDSLSAHLAVLDAEGTILATNQAWRRFARDNGDPPASSVGVGANYFAVLRRAQGPMRSEALAVLAGLQKVRAREVAEFLHEYSCHSPSEVRWYLLRATPLRGGGLVTAHQWVTERRLLEERLQEETGVSDTLNRIGLALAAELDFQKLTQIITDEVTKLTGARFGAFFYTTRSPAGDSMQLSSISGAGALYANAAGLPDPRRTPMFDSIFAGERVLRVDDVTHDPRYGQNPPHAGLPPGHLPVRSYLAAPVICREKKVLGVLLLGHPQPAMFTERHEQLAVGVAAQAAIAIENAELYAQATAQSRAKDEFLAVMSHELRQPLNAILGWAQILCAAQVPDERIRRGLEVIQRSVRAQAQIISDLQDISRISTGKLHLEMSLVNPIACIEAAKESVRFLAEEKQLRLELVAARAEVRVLADPVRLQQIVANLLLNAVKFTPRGGCIKVRMECVDSRVRIQVNDTGKGISAQSLPHIFERFWQADDSLTRRGYGGFGLGLAIVQHLVELHHGTVKAESPGEDQGATFTVELPCAEGEARAVPQAGGSEENAAAQLHGLKVLIVDDEADAREFAVWALSRKGAQAWAVGTARAALSAFEQHPPEVLICDIGMPGEDGYDLLRSVRALEARRGGHVPAIAMTAFARREDQERCHAAGFQGHMTKPIDAEQLVRAVVQAAGARSAR